MEKTPSKNICVGTSAFILRSFAHIERLIGSFQLSTAPTCRRIFVRLFSFFCYHTRSSFVLFLSFMKRSMYGDNDIQIQTQCNAEKVHYKCNMSFHWFASIFVLCRENIQKEKPEQSKKEQKNQYSRLSKKWPNSTQYYRIIYGWYCLIVLWRSSVL